MGDENLAAQLALYKALYKKAEAENVHLQDVLKELYSKVDLAFRTALNGDKP